MLVILEVSGMAIHYETDSWKYQISYIWIDIDIKSSQSTVMSSNRTTIVGILFDLFLGVWIWIQDMRHPTVWPHSLVGTFIFPPLGSFSHYRQPHCSLDIKDKPLTWEKSIRTQDRRVCWNSDMENGGGKGSHQWQTCQEEGLELEAVLAASLLLTF